MKDGDEQDDRPSGKVRAHTADTVPPPAGGDAYNAATEIREAPDDLLAIMRQVKEARAAKIPKAGGVPNIVIADDPAPAAAVPVPDPAPEPAPDPAPDPEPAPAPDLVPVAAAPTPLAASTDDDSLVEYPGAARRQRNRTTAVAVITILVVVAVVLVLITAVMGMRGTPA